MKGITIGRRWRSTVVVAITSNVFYAMAEPSANSEGVSFTGPGILAHSSIDSGFHQKPANLEKPKNLEELLALTPAEMERVDMARRNLLCAVGLPGSEDLDVEKSLSEIDELAREVKGYTDRYMPEYHRNPYVNGNKTGSEAYYRSLLLVSYLYTPFGISYHPDLNLPPDGRQRYRELVSKMAQDSRNSYLHGVVSGKKLGTCTTIPALIAAVGQRLGYPIKLAETKGHTFARWEGSTERFNIEGTRGGLQTPPDEAYKKFPVLLDEEAIRNGPYLKTMTAVEETASFLVARSVILFRQKRDQEAVLTVFAVHRLAPNARKYDGLLEWRDVFR